MIEYQRGSGRPRKDGLVRDIENNLRDPEGNIVEDPDAYVAELKAQEEEEIVDAAASSQGDMKALLSEMRDELKEELRREMTALQPGRVKPSGKWDYDYQNQSHLRVMGGLEVDHPEFRSGKERPHPPSRIPMYIAQGGGTTSSIDAPTKRYLKHDAVGNPQLDEHGQAIYTEVPIGKGAMKDENGDPILTDEYKFWLHVRSRGDRLDGTAMSDISAGKGLPPGAVAAAGVEFNDAGIPVTNG
jgi:hypothetical protein